MESEIKTRLVQYIKSRYKPKNGAATELWSSGNDTDVFSDGMSRGEATTLYNIATIIGLEVEELAEPDYDM